MSELRYLNDAMPEELRGNLYRSVKDYFGVALIFHHAKVVEDQDGLKAVFVASTKDDSKQFYISTRAAQPIQVANWMIENKPYPLVAQFMPKGRMTMLVDPRTPVDNPAPDLPF